MPRPLRKAKFTKTDMKLRDQAVLMRRLQGEEISKLQEEFKASRSTIDRALRRAREAHCVDVSRSFVLTDILAPALNALKVACEAGDTDVAMKVVESLGIIGKLAAAPDGGSSEVVEEFELFRKRVLRKTGDFTEAPAYVDGTAVEVDKDASAYASRRADPAAIGEGGEAGRPAGVQGLLPGATGGSPGDERLPSDRDADHAEAGLRPHDGWDEVAEKRRVRKQREEDEDDGA